MAVITPLFASTAQQGPVTSGPPVFGGQIRRAAGHLATSGPAPSHHAGPAPRGRSPGSGFPQPSPKGLKIGSVWRPAPERAAEEPGRDHRRPHLAAAPSRSCCPRAAGGGASRPRRAPGLGTGTPGEPAPHPHAAGRSCSARSPARPSRCAQEEGQGDGSRNGGFGGGPRRCLAGPLGCVPGL